MIPDFRNNLRVLSAFLIPFFGLLFSTAVFATDKDKITIAVGGKNLFLLSPAHNCRTKGVFQRAGINR